MSDRPFMNFWTGDYLKKTRHLTTLEHGAYLLLIMECWERPSGALPNKPELLARLAGLTLKEWNEISPIVLDFFKLNKRKKEYTQERVTEERAKVALKRELAQQSIAKRWNKKKKDDTNVLPPNNERNTNHNHNHIKKKTIQKKFDGVVEKEWTDWALQNGVSLRTIAIQKESFIEWWTEGKGKDTKREKWFLSWKSWFRKLDEYNPEYEPEDQNKQIWEAKLNAYEKGQWLPGWGCKPCVNGWKQAEHGEVPKELEERFIQISRGNNEGDSSRC